MKDTPRKAIEAIAIWFTGYLGRANNIALSAAQAFIMVKPIRHRANGIVWSASE